MIRAEQVFCVFEEHFDASADSQDIDHGLGIGVQ